MDWAGLVAITVVTALGLFSWRWSVPYNASTYRMVKGRDLDPASWMHKTLQVGRWAGVAFCAFMILIIISDWIAP